MAVLSFRNDLGFGPVLPRPRRPVPLPTIRPKAPSDPNLAPKQSTAAPVVGSGTPTVADPGRAYSSAPIVAPDPLAGDAYSTVYYSGPSFWSQYSGYFYWAVILYLAYRYRHQLMHLLRAAK